MLVTTLVHMCAKCGDLASAQQTFDRMRRREVDVWTAMIMGLGLHWKGEEALELFDEMVDHRIEPNDQTCVGVLYGCSHSGLVDEGMARFDSMTRVHNISSKVEHYSCMEDLLGRAGLLKDAMELTESMLVVPNGRLWGSLFSTYRVHGDIKLGEKVGNHLIELEPDRAGRYVLPTNLYASSGRYVDSITHIWRGSRILGRRSRSLQDDKMDEIEKKHRLRLRTQSMCCLISARTRHSEKLAIAFALIATSPGEVIRIAKNLRICRDCHSMAKAVAEVYGRELVTRDRSRFPHSRQGSCSLLKLLVRLYGFTYTL